MSLEVIQYQKKINIIITNYFFDGNHANGEYK